LPKFGVSAAKKVEAPVKKKRGSVKKRAGIPDDHEEIMRNVEAKCTMMSLSLPSR
jgi:hypothetical protein